VKNKELMLREAEANVLKNSRLADSGALQGRKVATQFLKTYALLQQEVFQLVLNYHRHYSEQQRSGMIGLIFYQIVEDSAELTDSLIHFAQLDSDSLEILLEIGRFAEALIELELDKLLFT